MTIFWADSLKYLAEVESQPIGNFLKSQIPVKFRPFINTFDKKLCNGLTKTDSPIGC